MKKYRIKKEAVPFILEKHATRVYDLGTWESIGIDINALEEVKPAHISFGIKTGENSANLGGWSKENGAEFEFTIHFPSVSFYEYDKFSKGRVTRELMDRIQRQIDNFYYGFLDGSLNEHE